MVRTTDGSRLPGNLLEDVRRVAEELTIPVSWREHELLMINNHTHMPRSKGNRGNTASDLCAPGQSDDEINERLAFCRRQHQ